MAGAVALQVALPLEGARPNKPELTVAVRPDDTHVKVDEVVVVGRITAVDSVGIMAGLAG